MFCVVNVLPAIIPPFLNVFSTQSHPALKPAPPERLTLTDRYAARLALKSAPHPGLTLTDRYASVLSNCTMRAGEYTRDSQSVTATSSKLVGSSSYAWKNMTDAVHTSLSLCSLPGKTSLSTMSSNAAWLKSFRATSMPLVNVDISSLKSQ